MMRFGGGKVGGRGISVGAAETPDRAIEGAIVCGLWVPDGPDDAAAVAQAFGSTSPGQVHGLLCCLLGLLAKLCHIYGLSHDGRCYGWESVCTRGAG